MRRRPCGAGTPYFDGLRRPAERSNHEPTNFFPVSNALAKRQLLHLFFVPRNLDIPSTCAKGGRLPMSTATNRRPGLLAEIPGPHQRGFFDAIEGGTTTPSFSACNANGGRSAYKNIPFCSGAGGPVAGDASKSCSSPMMCSRLEPVTPPRLLRCAGRNPRARRSAACKAVKVPAPPMRPLPFLGSSGVTPGEAPRNGVERPAKVFRPIYRRCTAHGSISNLGMRKPPSPGKSTQSRIHLGFLGISCGRPTVLFFLWEHGGPIPGLALPSCAGNATNKHGLALNGWGPGPPRVRWAPTGLVPALGDPRRLTGLLAAPSREKPRVDPWGHNFLLTTNPTPSQ